MATENQWYPTLQAALAALYAGIGDADRARHAFEVLASDDFASVPINEEWLLTTGLLADVCSFLGDTDRAAVLYEQLEPYRHRMVVGPLEAALGSAARPLGKLAATLGRPDDGARWLKRAALENERMGAVPWAAHAQREHAELLLARGDAQRAGALLATAEVTYHRLGMEHWASRCESKPKRRPPRSASVVIR